MLEINIPAGMDINEAATRASLILNLEQKDKGFIIFNGLKIIIYSDSRPEDIVEKYELASNCRRIKEGYND